MSNDDVMTIIIISSIIWVALGWLGDLIRQNHFSESGDPANIFLGPIILIMSAIESLIIKHREHKIEKAREELQMPVDKYEKRAIERINKLLEINN